MVALAVTLGLLALWRMESNTDRLESLIHEDRADVVEEPRLAEAVVTVNRVTIHAAACVRGDEPVDVCVLRRLGEDAQALLEKVDR